MHICESLRHFQTPIFTQTKTGSVLITIKHMLYKEKVSSYLLEVLLCVCEDGSMRATIVEKPLFSIGLISSCADQFSSCALLQSGIACLHVSFTAYEYFYKLSKSASFSRSSFSSGGVTIPSMISSSSVISNHPELQSKLMPTFLRVVELIHLDTF